MGRFCVDLVAFVFVLTLAFGGSAAFAGSCVSDDDCQPPTPICNLQCVECLLDLDCSEAAPRCSFAAGACGACISDDDCSRFPATPACGASGACNECSAGNDSLCGGNEPVCNDASGQCSACSSNADCSASEAGPVCLASGGCGMEAAGCGDVPVVDCGVAEQSLLRLLRASEPAGNVLLWKWNSGTIAPESFGDPVFTTNFALCLYRDGVRVAAAQIEPSASFWKETRSGFKFSHPVGNLAGMLKANLRSGNEDAKIAVKGKGERLELPGLPFGASTVTIQLVGDAASGSPCWGSDFSAPFGADRSTAFKARASQ